MIEGIVIGILFISSFIIGYNLGAKTVDKETLKPIKEIKEGITSMTDIPKDFIKSFTKEEIRRKEQVKANKKLWDDINNY